MHPLGLRGVLTMPGGVKLTDSTLVIVLLNREQEIERGLAFASRPVRAHGAGATSATGFLRRTTQGPGAELRGNDWRGVERRADIGQVQKRKFLQDLALFADALMFKTSPDRFDHRSGSACRPGFDPLGPT